MMAIVPQCPPLLFRLVALVSICMFACRCSPAVAQECYADDNARSLSETITHIVDIYGLLRAGRVRNDKGTGERFTKDVLLLVHDGTPECLRRVENEFNEFKWLSQVIPDQYAFVSVHAGHADSNLPSALKVPPLADHICPYPVAINRRGRAEPEIELYEPLFVSSTVSGTVRGFFYQSQRVQVVVVNDFSFPVDVSYIDHYLGVNNEIMTIKSLQPKGQESMNSFKGTTLRFRRNFEEDMEAHSLPEPLNELLLQHDAHFTARDVNCTFEDCGIMERPKDYVQDVEEENSRKQRLVKLREEDILAVTKRPFFTEVGFKKERIPNDVYDLLVMFFEDNKGSPSLEMWSSKGHQNNFFVNNMEAPTYMMYVTPNIREKIFDSLRPILEEWSGIELKPEALYGIRAYTRDNTLENHLDRSATHVISAIMNVAQDVDEEWPLNILDHDGNEYNVTMKPGDIVFYESATCLHGRPSPFQGNFFANIFCHYSPVDKSLWPDAK